MTILETLKKDGIWKSNMSVQESGKCEEGSEILSVLMTLKDKVCLSVGIQGNYILSISGGLSEDGVSFKDSFLNSSNRKCCEGGYFRNKPIKDLKSIISDPYYTRVLKNFQLDNKIKMKFNKLVSEWCPLEYYLDSEQVQGLYDKLLLTTTYFFYKKWENGGYKNGFASLGYFNYCWFGLSIVSKDSKDYVVIDLKAFHWNAYIKYIHRKKDYEAKEEEHIKNEHNKNLVLSREMLDKVTLLSFKNSKHFCNSNLKVIEQVSKSVPIIVSFPSYDFLGLFVSNKEMQICSLSSYLFESEYSKSFKHFISEVNDMNTIENIVKKWTMKSISKNLENVNNVYSELISIYQFIDSLGDFLCIKDNKLMVLLKEN